MFKVPNICSEQLEDISILPQDPVFTKRCSHSASVLFGLVSGIVICHMPIVAVKHLKV